MEISGTIYKILPVEEVTFNDGTKKMKGGLVIMRDGDFPKPVAFEMYGEDRLAMLANLTIGMPVRVFFYAESREGKNGNYYTSLRCTNIMTLAQVSPVQQMPLAAVYTNMQSPAPVPNPIPPAEEENDLPF